jgi:uncharacterized alpha-E superfamily protein
MGIISIEQTNRLYWLGRYTERVYTTIRLYSKCYDTMIDAIDKNYETFCRELEIPNIYTSKEDFNSRYTFDETDINSIYSNLIRAYDNAIVLRDEIGSETLSYIQLAIYAMNKAKLSKAPLLELHNVEDDILAFWGISDDYISDDAIRNIIKAGKCIERIDLYARLKIDAKQLKYEINKLIPRLEKSKMSFKKDEYDVLCKFADEDANVDYPSVVNLVENLLEE